MILLLGRSRNTTAKLHRPKQLEDGLREFKAEITERPFIYPAIALIAGFVFWTFPVRLIFSALRRLVSFLLVPSMLLIGIPKISELFPTAKREQGTARGRSVFQPYDRQPLPPWYEVASLATGQSARTLHYGSALRETLGSAEAAD
jgi:hypothetical protein